MCPVGEDELFVDLIRHDPGVGGDGGAADPCELVAGEDVSGRIVWGVDEDDRGPDLGDDRLEEIPVRGEAAPTIGQDRNRVQMTSGSGAIPPSFSSAQNSKPLTFVTSRNRAASSRLSNS